MRSGLREVAVVVGGVRGEDLRRCAARVQKALVENGGEVLQRAPEQVPGQPHVRASGRLPLPGKVDGVTEDGCQGGVVLAVVEVVGLGVLGEVDADPYDLGGQAV